MPSTCNRDKAASSTVSDSQMLMKYHYCCAHTALYVCEFLNMLCTHKVFLRTLTHQVITLTT